MAMPATALTGGFGEYCLPLSETLGSLLEWVFRMCRAAAVVVGRREAAEEGGDDEGLTRCMGGCLRDNDDIARRNGTTWALDPPSQDDGAHDGSPKTSGLGRRGGFKTARARRERSSWW